MTLSCYQNSMKQMKSNKSVKNTAEGSVSNLSSGRSTPRRSQSYGDAAADNDEDDEGDYDLPGDAAVVPTSDSCSASHEFEWISCRPCEASNVPYDAHLLEPKAFGEYNRPKSSLDEIYGVAFSSGTQTHQPQEANSTSSASAWSSKRTTGVDKLRYRLSPSPCRDNHGYHMSPMRSSWCCASPSPPPVVSCCMHHGGGYNVTGMELIPYPVDCHEGIPYSPYYRAHSPMQPLYMCGNYKCHPCPSPFIASEESSPGSPHGTYRPASRRSRSSGSRRKESSTRAYSDMNEPRPPSLFPQPPRNQRKEMWKKLPQNQDDNLQKINQLENEKKSLIMQVSVLSDQIEAQSEKINELEALLGQKEEQIKHVEQILQLEILERSGVENNKIQMMSEISNLKLRLSASDKDRKNSDERYRKLENELAQLHTHFADKEAELLSIKSNANQNVLLFNGKKESNIEKLCCALEQVLASSEEKDKKIEELKLALTKCKKVQDYVLSEHSRKDSKDSVTVPTAEHSSQSLDIENTKQLKGESLFNKPPPFPRPSATTSTLLVQSDTPKSSLRESAVQKCNAVPSEKKFYQSSVLKANSTENICPSLIKESTVIQQYGTMPRNNSRVVHCAKEKLQQRETENRIISPNSTLSAGESLSSVSAANSPELQKSEGTPQKPTEVPRSSRSKSTGVSFGKGFFKIRSGKRSSSAPDLADEEPAAVTAFETESCESSSPCFRSPILIKPERDKKKGFFRFFSKWKRSSSQNIERLEESFKRGGVRATAGPRLGWTNCLPNDNDIPFSLWNTDTLVEWLHKIGLSMYMNECKRWGCNGEKMLRATPRELEKELRIKNSLHKKKLILALGAMNSKSSEIPTSISKLDNQWVVRWLDDVGLPQYKDAFLEARIDGYVLNQLTVEDLFTLKVTNQLHHLSIKCGIQILRENNFDPHCLIRRSSADEAKSYTPELVALWTNHRVMEWLRTVDLSEYAPNLRGSGVHGALIVHEPKFNTDLFATLLNIPPAKTLLRRHLTTHFKDVVGADLVQLKRDVEVDASHIPLTPSTKVKAVRKGQFVLKKKHIKGEGGFEELVCPTDIPVTSVKSENDKLVVRRNSEPASRELRILNLQTFLKEEKLACTSGTSDI